ncbi:prepilin peptidase [Petroclostridium xylanilyticum]|uniref:prepilin peptidase n=1 Tax=Petroclostridium xylanilyticum TaxID=1792311 RepID=UPI0018E3C2D2|nr:A24 family peptidase [Petroclostridium xylanilyticum]
MINLLIFILGFLIGSFLNVCIHRIPLGQTVVTTPSHCPECNKRIRWYDLIPVISYILLRGKCRFCKQKISIRYPLVELLNGAVCLWIYSIYGMSVQFAGLAFLASALIVIAFIDYAHRIIPNRIVIVMLAAGIVYVYFNPYITYGDAILGFFAASLPLLILAVLSNGGMGGGDIKLMAAAGVFLGWKLILLSLVFASIIGSFIGIILILLKIIKREDPIPFGPFLSAGIFISILYGQKIIEWYLRFYKLS